MSRKGIIVKCFIIHTIDYTSRIGFDHRVFELFELLLETSFLLCTSWNFNDCPCLIFVMRLHRTCEMSAEPSREWLLVST